MKISRIEHYRLDEPLRGELVELLRGSFPSYPRDRAYFKLPPHFHLLGTEDGRLVGQTGVEYRVVGADGRVLTVFGVSDLCVAPGARSRGLASALLRAVEGLARESGVEFVVLFADDERLYRANGFVRAANVCRRVMIDEHRTLGIKDEALGDCLMYKQLGPTAWPSGPLDLLGHVF